MTQYTLHKLPEGFIVTSDEQAKEGELGYIPFQGGYIKTVGTYFADDWKKVIAQQDQIDFSALTEEEQKEIGWFDVERIQREKFLEFRAMISETPEKNLFEIGVREGFQKALELLSDRRFTSEHMTEFGQFMIRQYVLFMNRDDNFSKRMLSEFLSQHKSWTIEVETEEYVQEETGTELKWVGRRPKFTDGKLKVTKIL